MKIEKRNIINYFLQSFGVSKPFKVIFTNILLKKESEKFSFFRGEPYFSK